MRFHSIVAPDLNDHSVRIMEALFDRPASTISELTEILDRSEAAVQRAMKPLSLKGIVVRNAVTATYCLSAASPIARYEVNLMAAARAHGLTRNEAIYRAIHKFSEEHIVDTNDAIYTVANIAPNPFAESIAS